MFTKSYKKGTKLLLSITYEVPVEIVEDGVFTPPDLWQLGNNTLLQTGDLDSLLSDCKVVHETTPDDEQNASEKALTLWRNLCIGKDPATHPDLKPKQLQFVRDVIAAGYGAQLRTYSGRGMFGRYCPGVVVDHPAEVPTTVRYSQDNMGLSYIIYVQ